MVNLLGRRARLGLADPHTQFSASQLQMDRTDASFAEQASDWKALASLSVASLGYQGGKLAWMASMPRARALAPVAGLATEVSLYRATHQALSGAPGSALESKGWMSDAVNFGVLKGLGKSAQGAHPLLSHFIQDSGMVLGQNLAAGLGLAHAPQGNLFEQYLQAETTNLQLLAGMSLAGLTTGGRLQILEKYLETQFLAYESAAKWRAESWDGAALKGLAELRMGMAQAPFELPKEGENTIEWVTQVQRESYRSDPSLAQAAFEALRSSSSAAPARRLSLFAAFMLESGRNYMLRKRAYEGAFQLIEAEVLPLEPARQLEVINQVLEGIEASFPGIEGKGKQIRTNFIRFLDSIAKGNLKRGQGGGPLESLHLTPDTLYREVTRGLSLAELEMIVEFGELVNKDGYATFAEAQHAAAYQKSDASKALRTSGGLEVVLKLRVPAWQMKVGQPYGDMALVHFNDVSEAIPEAMVAQVRAKAEQGRRYADESESIRALQEKFQARFEAEHGRKPQGKEMDAFYRQLDYMRMLDALNRADTLPRLVDQWFDTSEGASPIAKLPARYVLWAESIALNRPRFEGSPERFEKDVLPILEEGRASRENEGPRRLPSLESIQLDLARTILEHPEDYAPTECLANSRRLLARIPQAFRSNAKMLLFIDRRVNSWEDYVERPRKIFPQLPLHPEFGREGWLQHGVAEMEGRIFDYDYAGQPGRPLAEYVGEMFGDAADIDVIEVPMSLTTGPRPLPLYGILEKAQLGELPRRPLSGYVASRPPARDTLGFDGIERRDASFRQWGYLRVERLGGGPIVATYGQKGEVSPERLALLLAKAVERKWPGSEDSKKRDLSIFLEPKRKGFNLAEAERESFQRSLQVLRDHGFRGRIELHYKLRGDLHWKKFTLDPAGQP